MEAAAWVAALWVAFGATHVGLSSAMLRPRLLASLGERGFGALYSMLALATFVALVWVYATHRHAGPPLWALGALPVVRWIAYAGMALAFALIAAGVARPSPAALGGGKPRVSGALRITRHPVFMGLALFGLMHLLMAPVNASELAFFGGFPLFVLLGARHQDRRKLQTGGETFRSFYRDTAFLPFSRPAGSLAALREDRVAVLIGLGAAVLMRALHPLLFGA